MSKRPAMTLIALGTALATAAIPFPANANTRDPSPISGPSPFTECTTDHPGDTFDTNSEVEPWIAVNPRNSRHLVTVWQQDRRAAGNARGIMAAVSRNGGEDWSPTVLPGFTLCSGGTHNRSGGPFVSFGPDGVLYATAASFTAPDGASTVLVSRSTDGGETWTQAAELIRDDIKTAWNDKPSITADPYNPRLVYAIWNRRHIPPDDHDTMLARSTDGGRTWEPAKPIYRPTPKGQATLGNQIVVLPGGTLVNAFTENEFPIGGPPWPTEDLSEHVRIIRSTDHGVTWSEPVTITRQKYNQPVLPDTGGTIPAPGMIPDIAVDRRSGAVYVVWGEDGLSTSKSAIGISASYDGGRRWSAPMRVDRTPDSPKGGNGQAILPQVDVGRDGTVAVTYFDFRKNTPEAGTPTNLWMATCRGRNCATSRTGWREQHLAGSFDLERAIQWYGGPYLGGYYSLTHTPTDFVAAFTATTDEADNKQDIFFTRARPRR
ncbi:sialidase family protein [Rhizohabitans arisaemae]|uniref:sialidase family protein n=1 Tax=Rhizohabitans arisaemae TaxID=2720610 RepID=UPI0024B276F8|nr:sialidase family protein [Rhizohabitans arisaemae]